MDRAIFMQTGVKRRRGGGGKKKPMDRATMYIHTNLG